MLAQGSWCHLAGSSLRQLGGRSATDCLKVSPNTQMLSQRFQKQTGQSVAAVGSASCALSSELCRNVSRGRSNICFCCNVGVPVCLSLLTLRRMPVSSDQAASASTGVICRGYSPPLRPRESPPRRLLKVRGQQPGQHSATFRSFHGQDGNKDEEPQPALLPRPDLCGGGVGGKSYGVLIS